MLTTLKRDWKFILLQSVVGAVVLLVLATGLSLAAGGAQRRLAERVDHNAALTVDGNKTVICILQLGLDDPKSPPRDTENIAHCVTDPDWAPLGGF